MNQKYFLIHHIENVHTTAAVLKTELQIPTNDVTGSRRHLGTCREAKVPRFEPENLKNKHYLDMKTFKCKS